MSDLIDRQAAIDAVKHAWAKGLEPSQYIEQLPAVQPEPKPDENGSEPFGNAEMLGDRTTDDCISRQAAIDAIENAFDRETILNRFVRKIAISTVRLLPSAQPEIIRCKDCKHKHLENMVWTCPFGLPGGENFFCGYGAEPYKGEQE